MQEKKELEIFLTKTCEEAKKLNILYKDKNNSL